MSEPRFLPSAIGRTPLVRLRRIGASERLILHAKLEGANPGGSAKDRAAFSMIARALESGDIEPGGTVIESTSGNMGIGLALACAHYGLNVICVVDPKATTQNLSIMRALGAQVEMVREPDPATGEYLPARLARVAALRELLADVYWPNQYGNAWNARAHEETMREILDALDGELNLLLCGVSTGGTLRGCSDFLARAGVEVDIVAVDAYGSEIFGGPSGRRQLPGLGAAITPPLVEHVQPSAVVYVSDAECVEACRALVRLEGLLVGGSSGGVMAAMNRLAPQLADGTRCALIFPDRGERYLETVYSDRWVSSNLPSATLAATL